MRLTKFVAGAGALLLVTSMGLTAAGAAAPAPIDVSNDHVTCNDVIGSIGFSTPLTLAGPTTGSNSITISIKSDDCTDTDNGSVSLKGSSAKGTLASNGGSSCVGLSGLSTSTSGSIPEKWTTNSGSPKITPTASTFNVNQTWGGTFNDGGNTSPASDSDSWGGVYGFFSVGSALSGIPKGSGQTYTTNPSVVGAFTGGDSGHASSFQGTLSESVGGLITACVKGIKKLAFGIGGTTLG